MIKEVLRCLGDSWFNWPHFYLWFSTQIQQKWLIFLKEWFKAIKMDFFQQWELKKTNKPPLTTTTTKTYVQRIWCCVSELEWHCVIQASSIVIDQTGTVTNWTD